MRIHVINLDRDADRWAGFQRRNSFLSDVVRFRGVDGGTVDRAALAAHGFITEPLSRSDADLGTACSHIALWYLAVETEQAVTIVDDDSVLAPDFPAAAAEILDRLPPDWGLIKWGWNFGDYLWAEIPEGVCLCRMAFDELRMRRNIGKFGAGRIAPVAVRLWHAMGHVAYSISPAGARAMLDAVLPMTDRTVSLKFGGAVMENRTSDVDMNMVYPSIPAYACLPPLALNENRPAAAAPAGRP